MGKMAVSRSNANYRFSKAQNRRDNVKEFGSTFVSLRDEDLAEAPSVMAINFNHAASPINSATAA